MDSRVLGLLILIGWGTSAVAFFYATAHRIPYLAALRRCAAWSVALVFFILFNYWFADLLGLSKESSGYVRGKNIVSPYGFLVQLLLIVEIGALIVVTRRVKSRKRVHPEQPTPSVPKPPTAREVLPTFPQSFASDQPTSHALPRQPVSTFRISGVTVFLLFCSASNLWLGAKALQHSPYGLFFVLVAIGLLIAAFNVSVKHHARKK